MSCYIRKLMIKCLMKQLMKKKQRYFALLLKLTKVCLKFSENKLEELKNCCAVFKMSRCFG